MIYMPMTWLGYSIKGDFYNENVISKPLPKPLPKPLRVHTNRGGVRKPPRFKQNKTPKDLVDRLSTQLDALQLGGRHR